MLKIILGFVRIAFGLLATVFFLWVLSGLAVLGFASSDNAGPADAIVVLGAAQYDGKPSPVFKARLDHALALWNRRLAKRLIVTGGRGEGDTMSEAAVARRYARRHGVPDSSILVENQGRTTNESIRAVAWILESRKLNRAILVSDPSHMFRLWILARRNGFTPLTSPTRTSPIDPNRRLRWRYMFNESIKAPGALFAERHVKRLLPPARRLIPSEANR